MIVDEARKLHRNNVEPHKEQFIFGDHRDYFKNLYTNSNSTHEGTYRGIKYNTAAVLSQHNLEKTTSALNGNVAIEQINTQIIATKKENRMCCTNMRTRTKRTQGTTENPDAFIRFNM